MSVEPGRIASLYEATLAPRLAELERLRLGLRHLIIKSSAVVAGPLLLLVFDDVFGHRVEWLFAWSGLPVFAVAFLLLVLAVVVVGVRYVVPGVTAYLNYRARFKRDVVAEIFKLVCPAATYSPDRGIAEKVFDGSGLFSTRDTHASDDRIRGRIGRTPFEAAEVRRSHSKYVSFHGLFFHVALDTALRGVTFVEPRASHPCGSGDRTDLSVVTVGRREFDDGFKVFASIEAEARDILTPQLVERLCALRGRTDQPVFLGFRGTRAFVAIHYGRKLFEPSIATTTSRAAIQEMASHFALVEDVVRELDLNTGPSAGAVDESIFEQTDPAADHALGALADKAGSLTDADVWKAAATAAGAVYETQEASTPRPPNTSVTIEHHAGGASVSYPLPLSFFVWIVAWLASGAICLRALPALVPYVVSYLGPYVGPTVVDLLLRVPPIPFADPVIVQFPLASLAGGTIVGSLASLVWMLRVRRVVVTADAMRVYRGLRPIPRRYARPPYDLVVQLEKTVHIGKKGGVMNPTASPMLTMEEARWVAAEMRRAARQTGAMRS